MKRIIVLATIALTAIPAFAQQAQRPSDEEINARMAAIQAQRTLISSLLGTRAAERS